jgi:hypothetical protein
MGLRSMVATEGCRVEVSQRLNVCRQLSTNSSVSQRCS